MATTRNVELDEDDIKILSALQENGRISYSDLGKLIQIPTSTAHDKVKRLIDEGVIEKFTVFLDDRIVGLNIVVIVGVETNAKLYKSVAEALAKIIEVVEVYGTTAQFDLMIKIQAQNRGELTQILDKVRAIDGIDDIFVFSVLEVFKDEHMRPLTHH